jgi:hypothetical protein
MSTASKIVVGTLAVSLLLSVGLFGNIVVTLG